MKMKVYLDTSVISALFDERNPERKLLTESFFDQLTNFSPFISIITIAEIERTPSLDLRDRMMRTISIIPVLSPGADVEGLASQYVDHGAIPDNYREDAYHISIAVLNEMDFLLSWNFKHIVKRKTRDIVKMVNTLNRLRQIEIVTPAELLED